MFTDMSEPDAAQGASQWDFRHHSERRSLIMCGGGAVLGLILAGMGLFTAQGTRIAGVPAEDVAIVNQVPILLSDYNTQLEGLFSVSLSQATSAQKRKVLDDMIREEIYVQRGVELGLQNDVTEVRTSLVGAVEGQQAVDASASQPDLRTLVEFYGEHRDKYATEGSIALDDFTVSDMQRGSAAATALKGGRALEEVIRQYQLVPTKLMSDGEEFYFAAKLHLDHALFEAARNTPAGSVAGPIQTGRTIHLMLIRLNVPPVVQPFSMVRDQVLNDYRTDKIARMQAGADQFLRRRADVQIARGFE